MMANEHFLACKKAQRDLNKYVQSNHTGSKQGDKKLKGGKNVRQTTVSDWKVFEWKVHEGVEVGA